MTTPPRPPSPLDAQPWPDRLTTRVLGALPTPCLHGYDVEADLACHYGAAEVLLLALVGDAPARETGQAVEAALVFDAGGAPGEAAVHAAQLARIIGVPAASLTAIAALALAEQSRERVARHRELLGWLPTPQTAPPASCLAHDDDEAAAVARLRLALHGRGVEVPALRHPLGRDPALLAVLWWAGLRRPEQLEIALTLARLGGVLAEALAARPRAIKSYPTNTPPFEEVTS